MNELFWVTDVTVPNDVGFSHFSMGHLLWLVFALLFAGCLAQFYRYGNTQTRRLILGTISALLLLDEGVKWFLVIRSGSISPDFLPLHLCSVHIFVILADVLRPSDRIREALCAVCLPGAFFALLFPGWTYLPMANAMTFQHFTTHILLLTYPVLLLAGGFHLRFSRLLRTLPWYFPALLAAYGANRLWGTNFFFLSSPGEGNPLRWFADRLGEPGYLLGIPILAMACWAVLYGAPRGFRSALDRKKHRSA